MSDPKAKLREDWNAFTDTLVALVESATDAVSLKADDLVRERLVRKRTELEGSLEEIENQIFEGAIKDLHAGLLMGEVIQRWQLPHSMLDDLAAKAKTAQEDVS
jgi:hypothetical protein